MDAHSKTALLELYEVSSSMTKQPDSFILFVIVFVFLFSLIVARDTGIYSYCLVTLITIKVQCIVNLCYTALLNKELWSRGGGGGAVYPS